jgi:hypothetical protein
MKPVDISKAPDFTIDQDSGARWSVYFNPDDAGYSILTGKGMELLQQDGPKIAELMRLYRFSELSGRMSVLSEMQEEVPVGMRKFLGSGQEASVFRMGDFAVREVGGIKNHYPALGELTRMDAINSAIDHGLPRWLNLPAHYLLQADSETMRMYTIMDRINGGLTAEDIMNYPDFPEGQEYRAQIVEAELGENIGTAKRDIGAVYNKTHEILARALSERGHNPDDFLTDWEPRNVLVQWAHTPIAGSKYVVNVIDQYRS